MKKIIISTYTAALITLLFLHNPFSGYITNTTQETKKLSYYPSSPEFTIEICKKMGQEQEAFESNKLSLNYEKSKLIGEFMRETNTDIKSKLGQDIQLNNNALDANQKKLSNSIYSFNKDCTKSLSSEKYQTPIPFRDWKTVNPAIKEFENLSQILYWTLYFTIISAFIIFMVRKKIN